MYIAPEAPWRVIAQTAKMVLLRSIGCVHMSLIAALFFVFISPSRASCMSLSSSSASAWSYGRCQSSDLRALSLLPCCRSHLGDSGMIRRPTDMRTGTMYISPRGIRYDSLPMIFAVKLSTTVPIREPTDVQIWKEEIIRPRYRAGTDSYSKLLSGAISVKALHGPRDRRALPGCTTARMS